MPDSHTHNTLNLPQYWQKDVNASVALALKEDIGSGDITAELITESTQMKASVITRESAVIAGEAWVNEVFQQIDPTVNLNWHANDGDKVEANSVLFDICGSARSLLTGERAALNFLQLLSGVASKCAEYADIVKGTGVTLLDTRKTIPGLRTAQKYAVTCGGCANHRIGLYDAFLIKENHIMACGSIEKAIATAKSNHPGKPVEIEVESLKELDQALQANADIIMLDNFTHADKIEAVNRTAGNAKLEASGGITRESLRTIAETGVDYISIGTLTKDVKSIDLSMRISEC